MSGETGGQVHYDRFTSGLESETHFRVEEKQVIAGRCGAAERRSERGLPRDARLRCAAQVCGDPVPRQRHVLPHGAV